jgi:bis(5'-nucleosyl)-tetraphosphatase (symmetrical)
VSTYVIGDLHGCLDPLKRLLDRLQFDPKQDKLWLTGDLINRGPDSLDTLRYVKALGQSCVCVLGNHDLHLLAVRHGIRKPSKKDTLNTIINAPDCDELLDWLRQLPLLHAQADLPYILVHAGIHPDWDEITAVTLAREVESVLRGDHYMDFLKNMYGDEPSTWSTSLSGYDRLRFAINVFTRMRFCQVDGHLDHDHKGPPYSAPITLLPWYQLLHPSWRTKTLIFGHWSSHPAMAAPWSMPLDRGCVWDGHLAAFDLETKTTISEAALAHGMK